MNKIVMAAAKAYVERYLKDSQLGADFLKIIEDMIRLEYFK